MHGGKRNGAGRPKGRANKKGTKMSEYETFEDALLISYLNHRFGEKSIDGLPWFLIKHDGTLSVSLTAIRERFGREAPARLRMWFNIDDGKPGTNSTAELRTGREQIKLYEHLWRKGLLPQLRRDPDGVFDCWADNQEWKVRHGAEQFKKEGLFPELIELLKGE